MAQIHALLIVSPDALTVDQIMERLLISRGNASMSLRNLMDWGLVRRFRMPGARKDSYVTEEDPWQMFVRVARERKRRELDPTAAAIKECVDHLPDNKNPEAAVARKRLRSLLEVFELLDVVYKQLISTDDAVRRAVGEFKGMH